MRAADQPLVDLGQLVAEQAKGDVVLLDVRVLGPRQQPDQPHALRPGHLAQLRRGDQVLGVFEDHPDADLLGRVLLHQDLADELIEQGEDSVRVAGPGLGLADPLGGLRDHPAQAVGVVAGEDAEPLAEVIPEDDVPGAEDLGGQEIGQAAVARDRAAGLGSRHEVVDVAVQHEHAGRAGEVEFGEFARPDREPGGHGGAGSPGSVVDGVAGEGDSLVLFEGRHGLSAPLGLPPPR